MRYWSKSAFFKGDRGWSFQTQKSSGRGHNLPTSVGIRKQVITLSKGIKIATICLFVSSQCMRVTDRQTDGHNYDPQDRASIAASRGKTVSFF